MDTDNTQIKYTSVQTQGEVLSDKPSLKGLEVETATKRDEGEGKEIKLFQTDVHKPGPSHALKHKGTHSGEDVPHTHAFEVDESRAHYKKSTQSHVNANDMSALCDTTPEDTFQRKERKVDGAQHGTSNDSAVRQKCVEVDLNREIKEGRDSLPNNENENPLQQDSFETDLEKEDKDLTLVYSEPPDNQLDPIVQDTEAHVQSEEIGRAHV